MERAIQITNLRVFQQIVHNAILSLVGLLLLLIMMDNIFQFILENTAKPGMIVQIVILIQGTTVLSVVLTATNTAIREKWMTITVKFLDTLTKAMLVFLVTQREIIDEEANIHMAFNIFCDSS